MNSNVLAFSEPREASRSAANLRAFSEVNNDGDEAAFAERTRIAQELHDTLLQGFIAASLQLHAAVDQLPADCATAKPRFSRVLQLLDCVIEQGRDVLQGMRERADRIGARLRLSSKVALGTEVELRVPGQIAFQQAATAAAR